jgi:hypothetical protein
MEILSKPSALGDPLWKSRLSNRTECRRGPGPICAIIHRFLDRDTPDLRIRGSVFLSANLQCGNMGHLTDSRIGTFRI